MTTRPVPSFLHGNPMKEIGEVRHSFTLSNLHEGIERCRWCNAPADNPIHTEPIQAVVVLSFTDWKEAVRFAREGTSSLPLMFDTATGKIEALYKVPTQFCDCLSDQGSGEGNKVKGWKLGPRMGWWVHRNCGKPAPAFGSGFGRRLFAVFGFNLLRNTSPTFYFPPPAVEKKGGEAKA